MTQNFLNLTFLIYIAESVSLTCTLTKALHFPENTKYSVHSAAQAVCLAWTAVRW